MSYATANEGDYHEDYLHFSNLAQFDPGVDKISLYIAISEVKKRSSSDEKKIYSLARIAENNKKIIVKTVQFKSNTGRDFSSAATNLRSIYPTASQDDYVLFVNRSAYGPHCHSWYKTYINQYEKFQNVFLCGSTINFLGHPNTRMQRSTHTHIQTYAYLSQIRHLSMILKHFPGEGEDTRLGVIDHGEVGLSQFFMEAGGAITCLAWPDHYFDQVKPNCYDLPQQDIKKESSTYPFKYKYKSYKKQRRLQYHLWQASITFNGLIKIPDRCSPAPRP